MKSLKEILEEVGTGYCLMKDKGSSFKNSYAFITTIDYELNSDSLSEIIVVFDSDGQFVSEYELIRDDDCEDTEDCKVYEKK